jgi:hypothetical protein
LTRDLGLAPDIVTDIPLQLTGSTFVSTAAMYPTIRHRWVRSMLWPDVAERGKNSVEGTVTLRLAFLGSIDDLNVGHSVSRH